VDEQQRQRRGTIEPPTCWMMFSAVVARGPRPTQRLEGRDIVGIMVMPAVPIRKSTMLMVR